MKYLLTVMLLFVLALSGCAEQGSTTPIPEPNPEEPTNPDVPTTSLQNFIRTGTDADLYERAITASGVYDDLAVNRYPLLLMFINEMSVLQAYIAEQGLNEETFLAHPKLPEFVKSHLIYEEVDVLELRTTPDAEVTLESAAGTEVVIENQPYPEVDLANGVAIDLGCLEGEDPTYETDAKGLLCYVAAPIVRDFDWSQ